MSELLHRDLVDACKRHGPAVVADVAMFCSGVDSPAETLAMKSLLTAKDELERCRAMVKYLEQAAPSEAVDLRTRLRCCRKSGKPAPILSKEAVAPPMAAQSDSPLTAAIFEQVMLALRARIPEVAESPKRPAADGARGRGKKAKTEVVVVEDVQEPQSVAVSKQPAKVSADPKQPAKVSADPKQPAKVSADPKQPAKVSADPKQAVKDTKQSDLARQLAECLKKSSSLPRCGTMPYQP